jgi:hypothetical protein
MDRVARGKTRQERTDGGQQVADARQQSGADHRDELAALDNIEQRVLASLVRFTI